jgi:hypothetical protein
VVGRLASLAETCGHGRTLEVDDMKIAQISPLMWMLPRVIALDRRAVRRRFEQRFSSARMATDYVAVYRSLLERSSISERETTVPLRRPLLAKELNGHAPHGERGRRAPETVDLF